MNETLLLDSNALIALFDGDKGVARAMASASRIAIPAVVCGEIDAGTQRDTAREREERKAFAELLALPNVAVIPVSQFKPFASKRAIEVFPTPRVPEKR